MEGSGCGTGRLSSAEEEGGIVEAGDCMGGDGQYGIPSPTSPMAFCYF